MAKKDTKTVASSEAVKENRYELVVIYPISENEIACERAIQDRVKKDGFKTEELSKWGVKNLAFPIKKQNRGYYLKLDLSGPSESAKKLEKSLQMDDKLLRYLLIAVK